MFCCKQEADAPAAGKTDDRGHAHVDIPAVHGKRDVGRHDLGNDGVDDHLQAVGAGGQHCFQRTGADAFHLLRVELGQRRHRVQPQRQHTGKGPDAHPYRKDDDHDQRFDRAQRVEHRACDRIDGHADGQ